MRAHQHTTRTAVASLLAATGLALTGCGADEPDPGTEVEDVTEGEVLPSGTPAAPEGSGTRLPFYGAYDRQFAEDRAVHEGQEVTLTAEVESVLSDHAFAVGDPDDVTLDPLLVVHDADVPQLEEGEALEVVGTVLPDFDVATAEEELGVDLEDALFEDRRGDPWLHATGATATEAE